MISKQLIFPWKSLTAEQVIFTHERFKLFLRWHLASRKKGGGQQKMLVLILAVPADPDLVTDGTEYFITHKTLNVL